jgi:uncharacterized membrane protein YbaN (DUF454 family)
MDRMPAASPVTEVRHWARDPRRLAFAAAGLACVGLGWIGVFVPGLPTTIFLIVASYCFARSCPWLEDRLLRVPVFAPYMRALDAGGGLSPKAARRAWASLWTSLSISLGVLWIAGRLPSWLAAVMIGAGCVGSAAIGYYARRPSSAGRQRAG